MFFFAVEFEFPVMLVKGDAIYYNSFDENVVFIWTHRHRVHPLASTSNLEGRKCCGEQLWNNVSIVVLDLCLEMS